MAFPVPDPVSLQHLGLVGDIGWPDEVKFKAFFMGLEIFQMHVWMTFSIFFPKAI
jgi:hypothetical protein